MIVRQTINIGFFGDGLTERAGLHASVKQLNAYRAEMTPDTVADEKRVTDQKTAFTPKIHNDNIANIKLFAQNPDIVTPVGIAVAPDGRVFVQENHTHKRKDDYEGPETDRILVFEDTDNDGVERMFQFANPV